MIIENVTVEKVIDVLGPVHGPLASTSRDGVRLLGPVLGRGTMVSYPTQGPAEVGTIPETCLCTFRVPTHLDGASKAARTLVNLREGGEGRLGGSQRGR